MASSRRRIRLLQSLLCCGVCSVCCAGSGGGWRRDEELGVGTAWDRTMDFCLERATESDCLLDADRRSPSPAVRGTRHPADLPSPLTGSLTEEEDDERSWSHARTVSSTPHKSSSSCCMVE